MENRFPLFIPTKGRYKTPYTIKALQKINVPFKAVVEKQEYNDYLPIVGKDNIIVLPHQNEGLTVTRNWIWDYAQNELKTPFFWTMDDNIRDFFRLHKNIKYRVTSGSFLYILEDLIMRYKNLYILGMNYEMFVPRKYKRKPFIMNTRIYSNMLIRTDIPYRNELFYNDDTDLCLRILKDGFCTLQTNVFLADKIATMTVKGGMTEYYKKTNSRLEFAKMLQQAHPDVVKVTHKYGRWHHQVNYKPFKNNRLIRDMSVDKPTGINNYGMVLTHKGKPMDAGA
jgi:hypothetical protein